jgi:hypothetical protein
MIWSDSRRGFGLGIAFIDHLQVVTTNNYNITADFHTLQLTSAHAESFYSVVFTSRSLVAASNSGDSSSASTKPSLHKLPYNWLTSNLSLAYNISAWNNRKHSSPIVAPIVSMGTCLFAKALLGNGRVYLPIKNVLPTIECCFVVCFEVVTQ